MKIQLHRVALPLRHPFTIARGTIKTQEAVLIELTHEGQTGLGEVTANSYYGHSLESICAAIDSVRSLLSDYDFRSPEQLWNDLRQPLGSDSFAQCAIDLAAHDLYGRLQRRPLTDVWGLDPGVIPDSSYTIGIDTIDKMIEKLQEMPGWSCYKIKLGTPNDLDIIRALRDETDATFRVDANCGWTAQQTVDMSRALADLDVEFIEQPLPADAARTDKQFVYDYSALPVIADENCIVESDVAACHRLFHGVNVKLCKCGGLTPARRMLHAARQLGMKTMVGCMVESSIGISAAAQLLPLLDYADLDGALLLADEPARGVTIDRGHVRYASSPGTGAELLHQRLDEFLMNGF